MAGGPAAGGPGLGRGSRLDCCPGLGRSAQFRPRLPWPRGPGLHRGSGLNSIVPQPINILAASILHGIEASPFLGTQVAVASHPAFRTPDMRLLIVQTPGFSGGQVPGSLSLVDSVLLALLTPVYPTIWRLRSVPLGCLGNLLVVDSRVAGISVGLGLIIGLHRLGIAPALAGIIGVGLGATVGWVAPTARP